MNTTQNPGIQPKVRTFQWDSFVIRIWWEHSAIAAPAMRGRIEHAASGEFIYFDRFSILEDFIQSWTERLPELPDEKKTAEIGMEFYK